MSYYDLLGVDREASAAEIRAAYRRLMRVGHPDLHGGGHALATRLNEAFEVLSDEHARAAYDLQLTQHVTAASLPEPSRYTPPSEVYGGFDEGCWDLPDWPR